MSNFESAEVENAFASIKFTGERFNHGKIPVESLQELLRYRELILAAAVHEWEKDHPGQQAPAFVRELLELTLTKVKEGSALPVLERTSENDFDEFFQDGKNSVDQLFYAVCSGGITSESFPHWADSDYFWEFGDTLQPEEVLSIPAPAGSAIRVADINQVSRARYFAPLRKNVRVVKRRTQSFSFLMGKVTALDAQNRSFELTVSSGATLRGFFKSVNLTRELKNVLGDVASAPDIQILGRVRFDAGIPDRIHEATLVTTLDDPYTPSAARCGRIGELEDGWLDGTGRAISLNVLRLSSQVLSSMRATGIKPPRIFPSEDGGMSFEWATAEYVLTIDVEPTGELIAYQLLPGHANGDEIVYDTPEELASIFKTWKDFVGE